MGKTEKKWKSRKKFTKNRKINGNSNFEFFKYKIFLKFFIFEIEFFSFNLNLSKIFVEKMISKRACA